jgi:hypothetical protein
LLGEEDDRSREIDRHCKFQNQPEDGVAPRISKHEIGLRLQRT